jgi:ferritin-like protein
MIQVSISDRFENSNKKIHERKKKLLKKRQTEIDRDRQRQAERAMPCLLDISSCKKWWIPRI